MEGEKGHTCESHFKDEKTEAIRLLCWRFEVIQNEEQILDVILKALASKQSKWTNAHFQLAEKVSGV